MTIDELQAEFPLHQRRHNGDATLTVIGWHPYGLIVTTYGGAGSMTWTPKHLRLAEVIPDPPTCPITEPTVIQYAEALIPGYGRTHLANLGLTPAPCRPRRHRRPLHLGRRRRTHDVAGRLST